MVDEIDRQDGWTSKRATFSAELIPLNSDSRVGYVPSKLASQMVEDDWAAQRKIMPIVTELTVLTGEAAAGGEEMDSGTESVVTVD